METTFYGAHVVTVMWLFTISLGDLVSKWCERPQQAVEDLWGKREKYMEDILAFGPSPVLVKPPWHITGTLSVWKHMATCTALLSPSRRGWELISFRMNSSRRWSLPLNSLFMPFMTMSGSPWTITQISSSHCLSLDPPSRGRLSNVRGEGRAFVGHFISGPSDGWWAKERKGKWGLQVLVTITVCSSVPSYPNMCSVLCLCLVRVCSQ